MSLLFKKRHCVCLGLKVPGSLGPGMHTASCRSAVNFYGGVLLCVCVLGGRGSVVELWFRLLLSLLSPQSSPTGSLPLMSHFPFPHI